MKPSKNLWQVWYDGEDGRPQSYLTHSSLREAQRMARDWRPQINPYNHSKRYARKVWIVRYVIY